MGFLFEKKRGKRGTRALTFDIVNKILPKSKRSQVTIFIIIAILLVAGAVTYFIVRGSFTTILIPKSLEPVYNTFLECVRQDTQTGISILQSQGGYIYLPDFEPGSSYMPFSSQLNFLGNPVPYWYYVSGNNIQKEQVPSQSQIEDQLALYISDKISNCNFKNYYEQGFEISLTEPSAKATIKNNKVEIKMEASFSIVRGNESAVIKSHEVSVNSKLGTLYDSAKKVYDQEQKNLFLEEYAVDNLRLYAPVDGTEVTCSPLIWNANTVFDKLQEAIEANTLALNSNLEKGYFDLNLPVTEEVRFLNSKNWPNGFEVTPVEGSLLVANPVGNQAGLGILGFCYVPYHFVYNVRYPVLVQVFSNDEIFQFPMAVVLQNNNPRKSLNGNAVEDIVPELCSYKNTKIQVAVKDKMENPIKADVSYECFGNKCAIGETSPEAGLLNENFPQCINGYVFARADGFKDTKYLLSTVSEGSINVIMDKLYAKNIQLKLDGANYNGEAIIYFVSDDYSRTVAYPEQKSVQLAEGQYEIQVYIYRNSSINIGATTAEQCINVARPGVLGALGFEEEKCFAINVPAQLVSQALAGGGKQNYYVLESELTSPGYIEINTDGLPLPTTIEQLQNNYLLFDTKGLKVNFR